MKNTLAHTMLYGFLLLTSCMAFGEELNQTSPRFVIQGEKTLAVFSGVADITVATQTLKVMEDTKTKTTCYILQTTLTSRGDIKANPLPSSSISCVKN